VLYELYIYFTDSNAVLKLQEHLREHRKQLEYEKSQKQLLDGKTKQMTKERADMQKYVVDNGHFKENKKSEGFSF